MITALAIKTHKIENKTLPNEYFKALMITKQHWLMRIKDKNTSAKTRKIGNPNEAISKKENMYLLCVNLISK